MDSEQGDLLGLKFTPGKAQIQTERSLALSTTPMVPGPQAMLHKRCFCPQPKPLLQAGLFHTQHPQSESLLSLFPSGYPEAAHPWAPMDQALLLQTVTRSYAGHPEQVTPGWGVTSVPIAMSID